MKLTSQWTCRLVIVLVGLFLFASDAHAQRLGRSFDSTDLRSVGDSGDADWGFGGNGELIYCSTTAPVSADVVCGVAVPGGMYVISQDEVLVSGRDAAGNGILEHWMQVGGSLTLQGALTLPASDFCGVVYRDGPQGAIYVLDCVGKKVLKGSWDRVSSLSTVTLSQWVDAAAVPYLANAVLLTLVPKIEDSGEMHLLEWPMMRASAFVTLADSLAGPVIGGGTDGFPMATSYTFLDGLTVTEGATTVDVWAPAGSSVEVVDLESATVIGAGVAGPSGALSVQLSQALVLGHRYVANPIGSPSPANHAVVCVCRHGFSESFSDGTNIRGMYFQRGAEIGNSFFVEVGMHNDTPPVGGAMYSGMMLIGFRQGGIDPLIPYGNNLLLLSGVYLPATGLVVEQNGWGLAHASLDIPPDPGLAGLVFLVQFVMEDGQDYRLSEVYGALIEGAPTAAAQSQQQQPGAGFAAMLHLQDALTAGRVMNAAMPLINVLSRR